MREMLRSELSRADERKRFQKGSVVSFFPPARAPAHGSCALVSSPSRSPAGMGLKPLVFCGHAFGQKTFNEENDASSQRGRDRLVYRSRLEHRRI
jgi:hypothetical protein